jgi:hypothetical protein
MQKLAWAIALFVFLLFFGLYSFRLGIRPALMHDDYEYTYPSFSLAERGDFGSPLLGPGLNIERRTYNLTVYYYATVHAALIRLYGDGPESIPLANTLHFALLAAAGAFFLVRRQAYLGLFVFLYALVTDERMVDAARHGRPEMTAGFGLTMGVLALWLWRGEGRHRPLVLFGTGMALTAGMLSHTSVVFFALALALVFAAPLARDAGPRGIGAGLLPFLAIPLLYGYFIWTDSLANLRGQLAPAQGDVVLGRILLVLLQGDWSARGSLASGFVATHAGSLFVWLAVAVCLALPVVSSHRLARGARFFAGVYGLLFLTHFLCLKHFVLSYRAIYQATLYLALALLAEVVAARVGERFEQAWTSALRVAGAVVLVVLIAATAVRFREGLRGQPLPYARLQGVLTYALRESGARAGDHVFVPSPFGFHLRRSFDVTAHPATKYFRGRWSPAFRDGLQRIWGRETLARAKPPSLCYGMELAFLRPAWVVSWDADYSSLQPFYRFLRQFPDLPGMQVERGRTAELPEPYGGSVRVYRLTLSEEIGALDRTLHADQAPCP